MILSFDQLRRALDDSPTTEARTGRASRYGGSGMNNSYSAEPGGSTAGRLLIGGEWVPAKSGRTFLTRNPSDLREVVAECADGSAADVDAAVEAARRMLPGWRSLSGPARGERLQRAAERVAACAEALAQQMAREMGKPIGESRAEVQRGVAILRYFAGEAWRPLGETIPSSDPRMLLYTTRRPLGVVAAVTPWNFPVAIPLWKLAPALAYGNTVVWKPASWSAGTAVALAQCLAEADLPVQLVTGGGEEVGMPLVCHRDVAGITFTGSEAAGRRVAQAALERGAKFQLELGGKNPAIVAADADLDSAVELVVSGAMRSAGQKCTATSRVIVDEVVVGPFVERLLDRVGSLRVGPALDEATYVGPLAAPERQQAVLAFIREAQVEGARLLAGGGVPEGEIHAHGAFVMPTVFDRVPRGGRLDQEEVFGPVIAVLPASSLDEAIALANDVRYGLSASLFTQDLAKAMRFAECIEAGMIRVNAETAGVEPQAPFGGVKASSSHSREQGRAAIEFFTEIHTISIHPGRVETSTPRAPA